MNRKATLGLIQMSCSEDIRGNNDKTLNRIKKAAQQGAQIICTQELFNSPYFCQSEDSQHFDLAEELDANSPTVEKLSKLAAELRIVLIASLFEKRAMGLYHNTTVVLDADGAPVQAEVTRATFGRATHTGQDSTPQFTWTGSAWAAPVVAGDGYWNLRLEMVAPDGTKFRRRFPLTAK